MTTEETMIRYAICSFYLNNQTDENWAELVRAVVWETTSAGPIKDLVKGVAHIVAADNCNYDGNTMRSQGMFEALREPLVKVQELMNPKKEEK